MKWLKKLFTKYDGPRIVNVKKTAKKYFMFSTCGEYVYVDKTYLQDVVDDKILNAQLVWKWARANKDKITSIDEATVRRLEKSNVGFKAK